MKYFAVFAAVLAMAAGGPATWTLQQLAEAIQNPATNPEYLPYLEHALNQMMEDIITGNPVVPVAVIKPTVSTWTLSELSAALQNPSTDPALVPYLEDALNQMMEIIHSGHQIESVPVVIPVGLEPVQVGTPVVPVPSPINPIPVLPTPVIPTPVEPETPEAPATPAASGPLVQIIIKINQQATDIVAPSPVMPEVVPTPVTVVEEAVDAYPLPPTNPIDILHPLPVHA